jgi:hypothetical protein
MKRSAVSLVLLFLVSVCSKQESGSSGPLGKTDRLDPFARRGPCTFLYPRLRGGEGSGQKAARARARLKRERAPPKKLRRCEQELFRDHVLVVDKKGSGVYERTYHPKVRPGGITTGTLRTDAATHSGHKPSMTIWELNRILRQRASAISPSGRANHSDSAEGAHGIGESGESPTDGGAVALTYEHEADEGNPESTPAGGREFDEREKPAHREPWQEILQDTAWIDKVLREDEHVDAMSATGIMYIKDQRPKRFEASASEFKAIHRLAEAGNCTAQLQVGLCYVYGTGGVNSHPALARKWLQQAAMQGDPAAQFCIGVCSRVGFGCPASPATALTWFERAAKQGHAHAQINAGLAYMRGWKGVGDGAGVEVDVYKGGVVW